MRTRIWTELTQAKHNTEFIVLYADLQRKYLRIFNIVILVFSSSGIFGWKIWNEFPIVVCVLISIMSMVRLLQPYLILSEKQIANLDKINLFYEAYYNKLEELWYENEKKIIADEAIKTKFYKLKKSETEIQLLVSETIRNQPRKLISVAKKYSDQYFEMTFKTSKYA